MKSPKHISSELAAPRLLRRERAAAYLDISPGSLDKLVKEDALPPPKIMGAFKVWDRVELDIFADGLPYAGAAAPDGGAE